MASPPRTERTVTYEEEGEASEEEGGTGAVEGELVAGGGGW